MWDKIGNQLEYNIREADLTESPILTADDFDRMMEDMKNHSSSSIRRSIKY